MQPTLHGYHVHIYYDDQTEQQAIRLHDRMVAEFQAKPTQAPFIGIAGPHPVAQRAVIFSTKKFTAAVVPWLMFYRRRRGRHGRASECGSIQSRAARAPWPGLHGRFGLS